MLAGVWERRGGGGASEDGVARTALGRTHPSLFTVPTHQYSTAPTGDQRLTNLTNRPWPRLHLSLIAPLAHHSRTRIAKVLMSLSRVSRIEIDWMMCLSARLTSNLTCATTAKTARRGGCAAATIDPMRGSHRKKTPSPPPLQNDQKNNGEGHRNLQTRGGR
eukprot:scaffold10285_cov105-Isochrysis_galbana.AAC.7